MQDQDKVRSNSNKKIALVFGLVAFVWYVVSMFTIWH